MGHEVFLWVHYQFDIILFSARRKQDLGKTGSQTYVRGPFVPLPLPLGQAGPHGTRATVGWQAGKEARRGLGDNCAPVVGKEHVQAGGTKLLQEPLLGQMEKKGKHKMKVQFLCIFWGEGSRSKTNVKINMPFVISGTGGIYNKALQSMQCKKKNSKKCKKNASCA